MNEEAYISLKSYWENQGTSILNFSGYSADGQ
jgi:hypothetical protein